MTIAKIAGREMAMEGAKNWSRDIRQALGSITVESFKRGSYSYTSIPPMREEARRGVWSSNWPYPAMYGRVCV